jgi:NADH dehydrogenase [ubiquinone] 1 alpha subcomplex assembly factor 7
MIEASPFMRKTQFRNLVSAQNGQEPSLNEPYSFNSQSAQSIKLTWLNDISELPKKEAVHFFLANEFFDALPINKFQVSKDQINILK